ncbi:porin [Sutterella massiliensis]|uniref:porin n=1 Tax=Sutterella massiliensis TaxID=1816689 RepID=UPI0034DF95DA
MTAEANQDSTYGKPEVDRWNISVGYDYALSKRTSVYTAAAYTKDSMKNWDATDRDPQTVEVMAGLIHKF